MPVSRLPSRVALYRRPGKGTWMEDIFAKAASLEFTDFPERALNFLTDLDSGWQIAAGGGAAC